MKAITNENNLGSSGGGGIELEDLNPDEILNTYQPNTTQPSVNGVMSLGFNSYTGTVANGTISYLPVQGYKKVAFKLADGSAVQAKWRFVFDDGTVESSLRTVSTSAWSEYVDIPDNATCAQFFGYHTASVSNPLYYSFIADKQVIPMMVNGDVNPECLTDGSNPNTALVVLDYNGSSGPHWKYPGANQLPVNGYKRIRIYINSNYTLIHHRFRLADGTFTTEFAAVNGWSEWITIPNNAITFCTSVITSAYQAMRYSLSTSES